MSKTTTGVVVVDLIVKAWQDDETGDWVSHCPLLDVYSQGETEEQAIGAIAEAVRMWTKVMQERGLSVRAKADGD